ncbi:MAG: hypothetical protein D6767_10420 [Candidatus Hydrogenedentota bacterium]|nr:MAG: hypothetical protein D6767_10420 [Candidatus Hydrogenedentota bacterium]
MRSKKGAIILMVVSAILVLSISVSLVFFSAASDEIKASRYLADRTKARYLAQSGMEAAVMLLTRVPIKYLYEFGILFSPPPLPFEEGLVQFSLSEETGKINLNRLIHTFDDDPDLRTREMLDKLSESLGISSEIWDGVVDWIDENSSRMPNGFERLDYESLTPPRKIKNARLDSLEELLLIPGFDYNLLYSDLRTKRQKEEMSEEFLTEEEKLAVTDEDFILANNITVLLPTTLDYGDKININSAPYHVILALNQSMTPDIARKIIVERIKNGGRFERVEDLKPILAGITGLTGAPLYDELLPRITVEDILFKIESHAAIRNVEVRIAAVFDRRARKLTMYTE